MEFWKPVIVIGGMLAWFPVVVVLFLIGRFIYHRIRGVKVEEALEQAAELENAIAGAPLEPGAKAGEHRPTEGPVKVH